MSIEIEEVAVTDLTPDPHNARRHPESNLSALASSLRQFGQQKPIIVTQDGTVIAGNGTLQAVKSLGWDTILVKRVPESWDEQTIKAYALADNRTAELATWDARELMTQLENLAGDFDMEDFGFEAIDLPEHSPAGGEGSGYTGENETRGLGTPIISYEIIFDTLEQQAVWFEFLKMARQLHPEATTNAERITTMLNELLGDS